MVVNARNEDVEVADADLIRSVIQRVATGPELSKNISYDEARATMHALLDGSADPVQAAVFLIGLRMKRETDDEIKGVMDAIRDRTVGAVVDVPDLVDLSDPYNGYNRTVPASLFVLPVIASCGVPAYSHGVEFVGPKFGVTHHDVIRALGGDPLLRVEDVRDRLAEPTIRWAYIDQRRFCPPLHLLRNLRTKIVKRPVLTTVEVLCGPMKAVDRTHFVSGFVHKPYPPIYTMLARAAGFDSALLIRGTEGGVIPSFRQRGRVVRYEGPGADESVDIEPGDFELRRAYRAMNIPESFARSAGEPGLAGRPDIDWNITRLAAFTAEAGVNALNGTEGPALDAVVFGAALIFWHLGMEPTMAAAAARARAQIASGAALSHLQAGLA